MFSALIIAKRKAFVNEVMRQALYIITGLPFSGKSTLAKELVRRFGFERTSVDKMMNQRHLEAQYMSQDDWDLVYSEAYQELEVLLRAGKTVAFDGGSLLKSERDKLKRIAEECGVPWKLIYVNTSKEEIAERRKKNLQTKERDQLADGVMEKAFSMFKKPRDDENFILFNSKTDLESWIKENIL